MCRYWAHTVFRQPFMQNVTQYLRLDTDSVLVEMPVDPFAVLESESLGYLSSVMYKESPVSTTGIWETFLRFALSRRADTPIGPGAALKAGGGRVFG